LCYNGNTSWRFAEHTRAVGDFSATAQKASSIDENRRARPRRSMRRAGVDRAAGEGASPGSDPRIERSKQAHWAENQAGRVQLDRHLALGSRFFIRSSAWPRFRQRYRSSTRRRSRRAAPVQHRRRGGTTRLHRRAVLGAMGLAKQFRMPEIVESRLPTVAAYGIGTIAAFWFVERLAGFWT
jgi:hypothetical protein